MEEFIVTPYEVKGEVDYEALIEKFGTSRITEELIGRIKKHTKDIHFMLRRKIFYSHRDLDWILDEYEKGNAFYLYTGRGPSGPVHLGHLMPWIFTKWLQDKFKVKLIFQMTDDEKFLFKHDLTLDQTNRYAYENALDVIALGFDKDKTEIIVDTEYIHNLYRIALMVAKKINFSLVKAVFGFNQSTNVGLLFFTSMQSAPAFLESYRKKKKVPCLIPCAIDQDPHFRITRDVAPSLGFPKPALIHCKFFPSLAGADKMSASVPSSSIYTTDTVEVARKKVMNAFTGGKPTVKEQREEGGNPRICAVFNYLAYFFEEDDKKLLEREKMCLAGELLCGECKNYLADKIARFLEDHQKKREKAKNVLEEFIVRDCDSK